VEEVGPSTPGDAGPSPAPAGAAGGRGQDWQLSAASVAAIPDLYQRYGYGLFGAALPRVLNETESSIPAPAVGGSAAPRRRGYGLGLLSPAWVRLLRRWRRELASVLSTFVAGPVQLLILVLFLSFARQPLRPSLTVSRLLSALEQILLILAIAWMILRVVESIEAIARNHALRRDKTILLPLLPVVRKTAKILIATFAGLAVLHSSRQRHHRAGGAGHRGIAVALAAQKTVENFIGSITLYADQPVRVGTSVASAGRAAPSRSRLALHTVRTLDRTVVTIPNGAFANLQLENFRHRDRFLVPSHLGCATRPPRTRSANPGRGAPAALCAPQGRLGSRACGSSASAAPRWTSSVQLRHRTDANEYLEVARTSIRLMDIVAAAARSFAFPSQTTYVEQGSGLDAARARAAEAQVQHGVSGRAVCAALAPEKIAEINNTLPYPADDHPQGQSPDGPMTPTSPPAVEGRLLLGVTPPVAGGGHGTRLPLPEGRFPLPI